MAVSRMTALVAALIVVGSLFPSTPALLAQEVAHQQLSGLRFRHIGPVGNRLASVAGVPGDRNTYYAGRRQRGHLEDGGRGAQLGTGVRRPAGALHRRAGGGSE